MNIRYCDIQCKSLEDINETCKRHIYNANRMLLDSMDAEDLSDTDLFYINMIKATWCDLLMDVENMLAKQNNQSSIE